MPINRRLLKNLSLSLAGAATVGGAGYAGHKIGFRSGVKKMSNAMSDEFNQLNIEENKGISTSAYKKGIADTLSYLQKQSSLNEGDNMNNDLMQKIAEEAFQDELQKIALNFGAIGATAKAAGQAIMPAMKKGWQTLKGSFSNLGQAGQEIKKSYNIMGAKNPHHQQSAGKHIQGAMSSLGKSKAALGTIGAGAYAATRGSSGD